MGIPSYFSYIIKNYTNIIRKDCEKIDNLFMDCNSIIYDSYHELENNYVKNSMNPPKKDEIENEIIKKVIEKIADYIDCISPSKRVYITFDGVAPCAKMEQQRKRRYKTYFMSKISNKSSLWNTSAITPGTEFMEKLTKEINIHYQCNLKYKINVLISCSDEAGEGEHKIFKYVRENDLSNEHTAIYGLDSDLIMLSIIHKEYTKNIYVFREAPHFKSVLSNKLEKNEKMFMDIELLCVAIEKEMSNGKETEETKESRKKDYILICFLLGNDFLPHISCLNIRSNGIRIIIETYKNVIANNNKYLIKNNMIKWKWVKIFLNEISKNEREYL